VGQFPTPALQKTLRSFRLEPVHGDVSAGPADAPEERQRPLHDAGDVLAPSLMLEEEADRRIDHMVEGDLVQPARANHLLDDRLDDFSESLGGI
jgi:hypothetical protein